MSGTIQLLGLLFSFLFGFLLYSFLHFNYVLFKSKNLFLFIVGEILVILLCSLFYVYILYQLNYGVFHLYFVLMILLGYFLHGVKICKP